MKVSWPVFFASIFVLAGCQSEPPFSVPPAQAVPLSGDELALVNAGILASLKDPESASISGVSGSTFSGSRYACGYVNARNSFGGYVGDIPFIGMFVTGGAGPAFAVISVSSSPSGVSATRRHCAERGIII